MKPNPGPAPLHACSAPLQTTSLHEYHIPNFKKLKSRNILLNIPYNLICKRKNLSHSARGGNMRLHGQCRELRYNWTIFKLHRMMVNHEKNDYFTCILQMLKNNT